uniref:Secreted protein n=1 Tax=Bursaphelenchus xylophilus TaxID=6326 RepID=A0A1I7RUD0_BURXY
MKLLVLVLVLLSVVQLSYSTPLGGKTGNMGDKKDSIVCFVNNCNQYSGNPEYKCIPTSSCHGKLYDKDGNFIRNV